MLASERFTRLLRRLGPLFRRAALSFLLLSLILGGTVWGQDLKRRVLARAAPSYPELAKRMHLSGKVKLELVITPAGSVKLARLVGGNPVFEKSAIDAAKQWRFETAEKETKAVILLEFAEP
jgi:TonB family protein